MRLAIIAAVCLLPPLIKKYVAKAVEGDETKSSSVKPHVK
jgi:hypothetical protein